MPMAKTSLIDASAISRCPSVFFWYFMSEQWVSIAERPEFSHTNSPWFLALHSPVGPHIHNC